MSWDAHKLRGNPNLNVVKLLLDKGADPNQGTARCFILAAVAGIDLIYRALSKYANLSVVLGTLLSRF